MTSHERIAEAINDGTWQNFRVSMKGKTTKVKLRMLHTYFIDAHEDAQTIVEEEKRIRETHNVRIRVDNYLKALARGGLLFPGVDLDNVIMRDWKPEIKRG